MTIINILKTIIFSLILSFSFISKADMCFKSFEEDTTDAKAIFVGKVVKIQNGQYWYQGKALTIFTFQVIESFKGLEERAEYISLVGPIKGCCNEHFIKDSIFLVFAYGECNNSRLLWTNDCSNTGLLSHEIENYNRLGVSIKFTPIWNDLNFMSMEEMKVDSLNNVIQKLKIHINSIQENRNSLKIHRMLLAVLSCVLIFTVYIITIRKNRKTNID